jgi:hypothetical protein
MIRLLQALERAEPALLMCGWRLDDIRKTPLPKLLRHMVRYAHRRD